MTHIRLTKGTEGRQCLFCDNIANSRQYVWPEWIFQRISMRYPSRMKMGKGVTQPVPNPKKKFKAVCASCAEGWMHELDQLNIPLVGSLMQDLALSLNDRQQYEIARWAVKMSMIRDFLRHRRRPLFYSQAEREQLRLARDWPMRTTVSLARLSCPNLIAILGTKSSSIDESVHAFATTIVVGYCAVQTVTLRYTEAWGKNVTVNVAAGPSPSSEMLIQIWPPRVSAQWPPNFSFDKDGGDSLRDLVRRYSYPKEWGPPSSAPMGRTAIQNTQRV
jgi:hypothetical protein